MIHFTELIQFILSFVPVFATLSIVYFFFVNSIYLFLLLASAVSLHKQTQLRSLRPSLRGAVRDFAPSISILAPAYNEEATVVESVKSFMMLNYPSFEVIVINDGSKDRTLFKLIEAFALERVDITPDTRLSDTRVRGTYRSKWHPNLIVVDKDNGGKADALNVGIGFSRYELFCAVDSDSLLENDALLKVAEPFMEKPNEVIASGGTVRIANGADVKFGRVEKVYIKKNVWVIMQIIEYTRAFLCGRIGWNALNSTLVISGAFGLFSKRAAVAVSGYSHGCIGEDMELIIRLHQYHLENKIPYSIVFVPDPVCWTEAPENASALGKQRDRWQRGLADTLARNRHMIFNPRFGVVGLVALPFFLLVELLGPVFELLSFIVIGLSLFLGGFDAHLLWIFLCASLLYGAVLSMTAVLIEEFYFSKYSRTAQFVTLFGICLAESFWYKQMSTYWRLRGLWKYVRGDRNWGHLNRVGFGGGPSAKTH